MFHMFTHKCYTDGLDVCQMSSLDQVVLTILVDKWENVTEKWSASYCDLNNMNLSSHQVKKYNLRLGRHRKNLFYLLTISCAFV